MNIGIKLVAMAAVVVAAVATAAADAAAAAAAAAVAVAVAVVFIASCALLTRSTLTTWGHRIHLLVSRHWRNL
jgi:hypothetical protein